MIAVVKILIVDDEPAIRQLVRRYAELEDYQVSEAANGFEAVELCRQDAFDVIVMDVMMPDMDGFAATREIRKHCGTPVLMLSARGTEVDKLYGFELGIDDYVVKPFRMEEVVARIRALVRRAGGFSSSQIEVGQYMLDTRMKQVTRDGLPISLTPQEYRLFAFMVHQRERVVSQMEITEHLYSQDFARDSNSVEVLVARLRKRLGADVIVTRRGHGYTLGGNF